MRQLVNARFLPTINSMVTLKSFGSVKKLTTAKPKAEAPIFWSAGRTRSAKSTAQRWTSMTAFSTSWRKGCGGLRVGPLLGYFNGNQQQSTPSKHKINIIQRSFDPEVTHVSSCRVCGDVSSTADEAWNKHSSNWCLNKTMGSVFWLSTKLFTFWSVHPLICTILGEYMQNMDFSTTITFHFGNMIDSASCLQCQDAEKLRVHEKGNCSPGFFQVTHFRNLPGVLL